VNLNSLATANKHIFDGANAPTLFVSTTGAVAIFDRQASAARATTAAGVVVVGKWYHLAYSRTSGQIYVNGVATGSPVADTSNYTGLIEYIGRNPTSDIVSGTIASPLIYNRALTAAEVVALYEAGTPSGADYNNASNTALNTSDFITQGTAFTTFSGVSATGFTAEQTAATTSVATARPVLSGRKSGSRFLVNFTATLTSGQAPSVRLYKALAGVSNQVTVTAGANSFILTATADAPDGVSFLTTAATSYAISGFSITPLGLLLAPDAQQPGGGTVWYDTSGNSANITLPASGVQWSVPTSGKIGNALSITNTTASTSTTTGSLVLSGGLGVAGALFTGGNVTVNGGTVGTAASTNLTLAGGSSGASLVLGQGANGAATLTSKGTGITALVGQAATAAFGEANATFAFKGNQGPGNIYLSGGFGESPFFGYLQTQRVNTGPSGYLVLQPSAGNLLIGGTTDITGSGGLKVFGTTASTSTTTGALQVAGGVGVAGALFAGGEIRNSHTTASLTSVAFTNLSATGLGLFARGGSTLASGNYVAQFLDFSGGTAALKVFSDVSQFAGSITTSAPTGGAGAWELGVANTVTPTAPNRTITIEIGGTVYYLAAKTTND
jgi:hypothetical protein